eukprot:snap_masked-scaffold_2-processed-gene-15.9-mRNA-1 protein AED:0.20 eAED:0.25 QI:0/-1/0/1/-1/1/1/0/696
MPARSPNVEKEGRCSYGRLSGLDYSQEGTINLSKVSNSNYGTMKRSYRSKRTTVNPVKIINYGTGGHSKYKSHFTKNYQPYNFYKYKNESATKTGDSKISVSGMKLNNYLSKDAKPNLSISSRGLSSIGRRKPYSSSPQKKRPQSANPNRSNGRTRSSSRPYAFEYVSPYKYTPSSKKVRSSTKVSSDTYANFDKFYLNLNKNNKNLKAQIQESGPGYSLKTAPSTKPNSSKSSTSFRGPSTRESAAVESYGISANHRRKSFEFNADRKRTSQGPHPISRIASRKQTQHQTERKRIQNLIMSPDWDGCGRPELYQFGKTLGQGSFGIVKLAHHRITGHKVAIKIYDKSKFKKSSQLKRAKQEVELMALLNSNFVSHFFESFEDYSTVPDSIGSSVQSLLPLDPNPDKSKPSSKIYIVMEALSGGNLCTYVKGRKYLQEREALNIFVQILQGLNYLHTQAQVVHRDIKLENILFTGSKRVKLADFGFSVFVETDPVTQVPKKLNSFCGTPSYMAPEIIKKKGYYPFPVDVWSLGVVFYAMLFGRFPFRAKNHDELYKLILQGYFSAPEGHNQTDMLSKESWRLLNKMIIVDVKKRPTVAELLQNEFIKKVISSNMNETRSGSESLESNGGKECLHLVSNDAVDDLKENLCGQLVKFGFSNDRLKKSVLRKKRNHITATYYLLRMKQGKKRSPKQRSR